MTETKTFSIMEAITIFNSSYITLNYSGCPLFSNFEIQPIFIKKCSFFSLFGSNFILFTSHAKNFDIKFQPYKIIMPVKSVHLSTMVPNNFEISSSVMLANALNCQVWMEKVLKRMF